jgi:hypothetical protein
MMRTLQEFKNDLGIQMWKQQLADEVRLAVNLDGALNVDRLRKARGETVNALLDVLALYGCDREECLEEAGREVGLVGIPED